MKKSKFFILGAVVILILTSIPNVVGDIKINNNMKEEDFQTGFKAENIDETTIKITLNPGEFDFGTEYTEQGLFATVALPNFVHTYIEGQAQLPIIRKMIEIPYKSEPEITINSLSWKYISLEELLLPDKIIPAQFSVEKIPEPIDDFVIDDEYFTIDSFVPEQFVKIVETGIIRGRQFALVEISPLKYRPSTGEIKTIENCVITIDLPNSDMTKTYENIDRYSTHRYEQFFDKAFANYGFYEEGLSTRNSEGFLIIVYDTFYDEIQPLVTEKESKGFDVTTIKTSDIPGGATKENIYDYIEDAYNTWSPPPSYVLLVGDTPQIPTYYGTTGPSAVDLYYVTVDGSDWIPDIHIGRFTGSTETQIEVMVEKTVDYEQANFPNYDWIKKAAFLASTDRYWVSEGTHNFVIDNYLDPEGYTCDKLYTYTYGATTQDVHDAINDGRSLVIFSGHGSPNGWGDGPSFYKSDIQALTNTDMYPFVGSHSCSTNTFDDSECFGETWLREADKGGLAFWGASASTYWDEDDILEKGMFQAWWEDGLEWIGGMTDMGLMYLYENYSGGGLTKYYFEAYNVNGDPSVKIWSSNPSQSPAKPTIPFGPDEWIINVETTFSSTTTDPEGNSIYYLFDWGDGNNSGWVGPYNSGQTGEASYAWTEFGNYEVTVVAKDEFNAISEWSDPAIISIVENENPDRPTISGKNYGFGGVSYDFTFQAVDPDGHDIYYSIDWDDGNSTGWLGPYSSGEEITLTHSWNKKGEYWIKAWAKDIMDEESIQANHKINILTDKSKQINTVITQILESLIGRFPIIAKVLQNL
jgi:hypothetical protein